MKYRARSRFAARGVPTTFTTFGSVRSSGRVISAAMVAGALVASLLLAWTSLRSSLLILGGASLLATVACLGRLRGLDALSRQRSEALAGRVAVVQALPIAAGVPQIVIEQLASASQFSIAIDMRPESSRLAHMMSLTMRASRSASPEITSSSPLRCDS